MKAVQQDEPGGKLTHREVPTPRPKAGQVLIRMAAAPINPSDLGSLWGMNYRGERTYPFIPGIEGSGIVVEAGEGFLPRFLNGRRVACTAPQPGNGTWAEYMVTPAALCIPLNKQVSLEQGAMLVVNPLTALAIFDIVRQDNHKAIVNTAAASALGGMIIRLGQRHNIPIIHIVRRPEQIEIVRERGGEIILNSTDADFLEQLQTVTQKLKATLLLDAIGGNMTQQLAEAAPYGSTILLYSRLSQKDSVINPQTMLVKQLKIQGWFLGNWLQGKNPIQSLLLSRTAQSMISADLQSPIRQRLPLSAAQEGLEMYINNMSAGKILFVANPEE
jgi:NADPH:quinone reductase-like Zn-dependent oxidoreductase